MPGNTQMCPVCGKWVNDPKTCPKCGAALDANTPVITRDPPGGWPTHTDDEKPITITMPKHMWDAVWVQMYQYATNCQVDGMSEHQWASFTAAMAEIDKANPV